jgi:ankyrin repeat protein
MAPKKRFKKKSASKWHSNDSAPKGTTTPLHAAARSGDAAAITALLVGGDHMKAINARDEHARTALHLAAWAGSAPALEALVKAGADVALGAVDRTTALHFAVKKGVAGVEVLLAAGAPVDAACARTDKTPLHLAAAAANAPVVAALLAGGANRALRTKQGATARDLAAENAELAALFDTAPELTEPTSLGEDADDADEEDAFI